MGTDLTSTPSSCSSRPSPTRSLRRNRHFGSAWGRPVDALIGGWQLGGVWTAHTGFPLTIKYASDTSGTGQRSYRVDVVGTPDDPHQIGPGVPIPRQPTWC